jgi:hypothetical protein
MQRARPRPSAPWDHLRMSGGRLSVLAVCGALAATGALGCGGDDGGSTASSSDTTPGSPPVTTETTPARSPLELPASVPERPTGPADRASTRVIRRWLAALNRGDVTRAAHFFALPSKFQNTGTPVLTVDSERERIAVNLSLTCGAQAIETGGAGRYTIVTFRLIERPGGECGTGTGGTARGAILVARGRIREWYRLPDEPGGEPTAPAAPSGPSA